MTLPDEAVTTASGAELIAAERRRQVVAEGWTPEHDDAHTTGDLVAAAVAYAVHDQDPHWVQRPLWGHNPPPMMWPWNRSWWKPSDDPVRNLVKAGALIAAEIDRLQRRAQ